MELNTIRSGAHIHHATLKQGRNQAYRVRVTSVKIWKRKDKVDISIRWGIYGRNEHIVGTKAEVEKELENWHPGFYGDHCPVCSDLLKAKELGVRLHEWHPSVAHSIYALGSLLVAGKLLSIDQELVADVVCALERGGTEEELKLRDDVLDWYYAVLR